MQYPRTLLIPPTPFERRMDQLGRAFPPPPSHPLYKILSKRAEMWAERDISFRVWAREAQKKFPSFVLARMEGGTHLPVANILREYFQEYASRIVGHGFHSMPTSFNVVESFLTFCHDYLVFDLRVEREHLLCLHDFIDWYTSGVQLKEPQVLTEIVPEGVILSYNMVTPPENYKIQTEGSELVVSGIALVRHSTELSMIALCGESPAYPADNNSSWAEDIRPISGKEALTPDPALSAHDRYLKELPDYAKVVALVRFDLTGRQYFVRYINRDIGTGYMVDTDDPSIFTAEFDEIKRKKIQNASRVTLDRYGPLFSSLVMFMYLPAYFVAEHGRVSEIAFSTRLRTRRNSTEVRRALRHLPRNALCFSRKVSCLKSTIVASADNERTIVPPDFEVTSKGLWKSLPAGEVGEDQSGNPIVGKTWVKRTDAWSQHGVEKFVVRRPENRICGPNPGWVYIMRSGSHRIDLYKMGKTRRSVDVRARELSGATGVPTQLEVLFRWEVGDIDFVEKEAQRRLERYRVNRRREFFNCPLQVIVETIVDIVREKSEG